MKIFGNPPFKLPASFKGEFNILGIEDKCKEACIFAYQNLKQTKRVQTLILIEPKENLPFLKEIKDTKCKIYFFLKERDFKEAKKYAPYGIVFLSNTPVAFYNLFQSL
ncbi:hypothetical protein [Helicobacter burdigaliensis]|uniref:hypothetical protein n=1 Tax=Helicobacter burdigaliensis TaxID=2315334 RepID=UPI000EF6FAF3|nr:hypothetical protein [Helicobacter burdigaliensis]